MVISYNASYFLRFRFAILAVCICLTANRSAEASDAFENSGAKKSKTLPSEHLGEQPQSPRRDEALLVPGPAAVLQENAPLTLPVDAAPVSIPPNAAMKNAIAAELAASAKEPKRGIPLSEFRAEQFERFAKNFAEAKVPDCLHGEALKRQPPVLLFVRLEGLYAVPFVLLAKVRGKCV